MPGEVSKYGALARFLRSSAGRLGAIEHRMRELGILDDTIAFELRSLRRSCSRWADRIDAPPVRASIDDEPTVPIGMPRPERDED